MKEGLTVWDISKKTSLDEIPSLVNVINDMSIVGPRPLLMEYLPLYSNEQRKDMKLNQAYD